MIIHGDSLEVLKTMEDNSVDSIVSDPPYGISFMGKKWDYDVPSVEVWKETLRVLKPGGHALIACGTRTQHRMAVNLEDAGFEIRDIVAWVYASGFPKSLNVRLNIDKQFDIIKDICLKSPALIATDNFIEAPHTSNAEFFAIEPVEQSSQQPEQNVKYVVRNSSKRTAKSKIQGITIAEKCVKDLLRESLVDKIKGEEAQKTLLGKWLSSKETNISANFAELIENLKHTILKKLETFPNYDTTLPTECVFAINVTTTESIKECLIINTVDILKEINNQIHKGIGTALKPAMELWTLCRKPLEEKTVAQNVLKYGTGGINIDSCRVGTDGGGTHCNNRDESGKCLGHKDINDKYGETIHADDGGVQGRFPANLILSYPENEYIIKDTITNEQKEKALKWIDENTKHAMQNMSEETLPKTE